MKNMLKTILALFAALIIGIVSACDAITASGAKCKRNPSPGSRYCWQHGGNTASKLSGIKLPKSYEVHQQRKSGGRVFSAALKKRKYDEQGGVRPHCGKRCEYAEMEGDHILPYSKGGKTEYSNLQMLCRPCNRKKGNRYSY